MTGRQIFQEFIAQFLERYSSTHEWFPALDGYKGGQGRAPIEAARRQIATDRSFVAYIYSRIRGRDYPEAADVGPAWALFRWLQVQLLYCVEYIRRYGANRTDVVSKRVSNDVIDCQYVVTALLVEAIATRDTFLRDAVLLLKPSAEIRD